MRRLLAAALLAAPLLLASPGEASAHNGPCTFGLGFCGNCLRLFPHIHQHGPLFNYGPYYGYPPFEPYGPWNAYLQYNPWYYGSGYGNGYGGGHGHGGLFHRGGDGCGHCGHFHAGWRDGGWFRGHGCVGCGSHSLFSGGLFGGHGCSSCGRAKSSCGGCTADAGTTADPATRFAGAGSPQEYAHFYAGLPTLAVTPAGGAR